MVFKDKLRVPMEFHLEVTCDQHQFYLSQFCKRLSTPYDNTISDQKTIDQPLLTKTVVSYTSKIQKSMH